MVCVLHDWMLPVWHKKQLMRNYDWPLWSILMITLQSLVQFLNILRLLNNDLHSSNQHTIYRQKTKEREKEINKIARHTCGSEGMQSLTHACLANLPHGHCTSFATAESRQLWTFWSLKQVNTEAVKLKHTGAHPCIHIHPAVRWSKLQFCIVDHPSIIE